LLEELPIHKLLTAWELKSLPQHTNNHIEVKNSQKLYDADAKPVIEQEKKHYSHLTMTGFQYA